MQLWRPGFFAAVLFAVLFAWTPLSAQRGSNDQEHHRAQARGSEPAQRRGATQNRRQPPPPPATRGRGEQGRPSGRAAARPAPRAPEAGTRRTAPTTGVAVPRGAVRGPERGRVYAEPRVYGYSRPRAVVPVIVYPRPYYVFRPRFWIGFGLYVGVPVPYPVAFGYPTYVYGYPGYPLPANAPPPAPESYGGVSFDITPPDAGVAVDGVYVGIASDFSPTHQPLTLTPGRHHIELQAEGMEPLAFDVDVVPGEVIPYRGTLQPR